MAFGSEGPNAHFGSVDEANPGSSGPWPGFYGVAPPAIAATGTAGATGKGADGGHTHAGVHTVNGLLGDVLINTVQTLDSVNNGGAQLSSLASLNFGAGALAWVVSVGAFFVLQQSALSVDHLTVETASGKAGYQWLRVSMQNLKWQGQTAWTVDPQNGAASDENAGTGGSPLKTLTELSRRLAQAVIPSGTVVNVSLLSDCLNTDKPVWTFLVQEGSGSGDGLVVTGTPTVIYTGTIATASSPAANVPSANDYEISDSGIPVSYTASGLIASGLSFKRTNSTALFWYGIKDLGSKTARISSPCTAAGVQTALSNGDTYTVSRLPKIYDQFFPVITENRGGRMTFALCDDNSTTPGSGSAPNVAAAFVHDRVTYSTSQVWTGGTFINCAWWANPSFAGQGFCRFTGEAVFVCTTVIVGNACAISSNGDMMFQGAQFGLTAGAHGLNNVGFSFYDCTTTPACLLASNGVGNAFLYIRGSGNTVPMIKVSVFTGCTGSAPCTVDGSTSSGTVLVVGTLTGNSASFPLVDASSLSILRQQT